MKKIIALILALNIMVLSASGCGAVADDRKNDGIKIVTTIFPIYDWVREITADSPTDIEITLLLDSGVDLHSYQPTAEDILKIKESDLFIYIGGESDEWAEDVLDENINALNLMDTLGELAKFEEEVEGMQEDEDEEDEEYDEHIWLSLRNAQLLCKEIAEKIKVLDENNASVYEGNAKGYIKELGVLDDEYKAAVEGAEKKILLFGDRFPFRYLTDDYGLMYYAAFAGCSAETEASFETIAFLSQKADELGLKSIMIIDGSDGKIAETIRDNTISKKQEIISLNSMQGTTLNDIKDGAEYLAIMKENLEALKKALN